MINSDYRKTKLCPDCGKLILKTSKFCNSCSQHGSRNRMYKDGSKRANRYCQRCNRQISPASSAFCQDCYNLNRRESAKKLVKYNYSRFEMAKWRKAILDKDSYTCQECGKHHPKGKGLNAHHILPKKFFTNLIFQAYNGITLCNKCHWKIKGKEMNYASKFFGFSD